MALPCLMVSMLGGGYGMLRSACGRLPGHHVIFPECHVMLVCHFIGVMLCFLSVT